MNANPVRGPMPTKTKTPKRELLDSLKTWWGHPKETILSSERALILQEGIYIKNPMNSRGGNNWRATFGERKRVRTKMMHALATVDVADLVRFLGGWPTHVTMTRCSTRLLDKGAEWATLKSVQDQIAAWLAGDNTPTGKGDDGPKSGIEWRCAQHISKAHGVVVEIARRP